SDMDPQLFATRLQRLIIPTIMLAGLDAHQIINERERSIDARIQQRIRELEAMPATMGDGFLTLIFTWSRTTAKKIRRMRYVSEDPRVS
ncbi:MAG TPA: hypothetical protein VIL90_03205, partial [Puia sp.]